MLRINDKDYSITFATYFNVEWTERRLFVDPELQVRANEKKSERVSFQEKYLLYQEKVKNKSDPLLRPMNLEFVKDLWLPNIFIYRQQSHLSYD